MSHEDFYVYTVVHIAKHLTCGGSGIRPIMDMYLYLKNYQDILNWDYINTTLGTVGLCTLESELKKLCDWWFGGGEAADVTRSLSAYLVASGIFGTVNNAEVQREVYKKTGANITKRPGLLKMTFLSYKNLVIRYPSLKKAPFLLPFYWIIRIFQVLLHKRDKIAPLIGNTTTIHQEKINETRKFFVS